MKTNLNLASFFVLCLSLLISAPGMAFQQDRDPYLTRSFDVSIPADVKVETSGGSITVVGGTGQQIEVKMYVKKNGISWFGSDDDIEESLEDYDINISKSGNTVYAIAERQGSGWSSSSLSISFVLEVPRELDSEIKTSGGSINLTALEGNHEVHTSGGSLNFEDIIGYTKASTSGGSINLSNFRGTIDGKTSGGSIRVQNADGDLDLHTSGGSIVLEDVRGSIEARTSGGSIKAFVLDVDEYLTLKTSGGSVNAVIPEGRGFDLDLSGNRVNTELTNFSGSSEKNSVEGTMNGGGPEVTLKTSGGSVNLDYHRVEARY